MEKNIWNMGPYLKLISGLQYSTISNPSCIQYQRQKIVFKKNHKLTSRHYYMCTCIYLLFLSISKAENNVVFYLLTFTETVTKFTVNNLAAFRTELDAFNISMASRINLVRVHYRCYRQAVTVLLSIRTFTIDAIHFFLRHLSCIT